MSQTYRIISDDINDVHNWNDVRDVVRAVLETLWKEELPKDIYPHVVQAFVSWVDRAQKLSPTYINPQPYV